MAEMKSLNGYEIVDKTARDRIENLEISGENLLVSGAKYTRETPFILSGTSTDIYIIITNMSTIIPVVKGQEYILQIKTDGAWGYHDTSGKADSKNVIAWIYCVDNPFEAQYNNYICLDAASNIGNEKQGIWKFTCNDNMVGKYFLVRVNAYSDGSKTVTRKFWDFKLEAGNVPTAYSLAPADIQRRALYGYTEPSNSTGKNRDIYFLL